MTRLQYELRERLLDALQRREVALPWLAAKVGISTKHLAEMLNGKHAGQSIEIWQDCFDALGFRVDVKIVRKPKVRLDL